MKVPLEMHVEFGPSEIPQPPGKPAPKRAIEVHSNIDSNSSDTMSVSNSSDECMVIDDEKPPDIVTYSNGPCRDKAFEVFCGAAGLTLTLSKAGFRAVGIDYQGNKDKPRSRCLYLDLTTPAGQAAIRKEIISVLVAYTHFAPPCGTASRAREKRRLNEDGSPAALDPRPLRSAQFPDGLPTLQGRDKARVEAANTLYKLTVDLCKELSKVGAQWSIENLTNSRMWDTAAFKQWFAEGKVGEHNWVNFRSHFGSRSTASQVIQCCIRCGVVPC
jgi:hypothetical protein